MTQSTDRGVIVLSPAQCRAARAWLNWNQSTLSERSGVGLTAIRDFEGEVRRTLRSIRAQLQRAFEDAGVAFPDEQSIRVTPRQG
jgi:hypothetical protein